jgi:hypothetical protein
VIARLDLAGHPVGRVERERHRALVVREPAQDRVLGPAEVGDRQLLAAHEVVHRDLAAQARGIGHGAVLDLVALEAGGLELPLLGDDVAAGPLGQRVPGDEHGDGLRPLVHGVSIRAHEREQQADRDQPGERREGEGALTGG